MNNETEKQNTELIMATASAMDNLPIIYRLEFVKNLIFDKGGDANGLPNDGVLILAFDVLNDVIDVLRKTPKVAQLGAPEP